MGGVGYRALPGVSSMAPAPTGGRGQGTCWAEVEPEAQVVPSAGAAPPGNPGELANRAGMKRRRVTKTDKGQGERQRTCGEAGWRWATGSEEVTQPCLPVPLPLLRLADARSHPPSVCWFACLLMLDVLSALQSPSLPPPSRPAHASLLFQDPDGGPLGGLLQSCPALRKIQFSEKVPGL